MVRSRTALAALALVSCALPSLGAYSGGGGGTANGDDASTPAQDASVDTSDVAPRSCKDVKTHDASTGDGFSTISPSGTAIVVWCDMTIDGGGWTLIGRSAGGGAGPFGWRSPRGDVHDDTKPYVLDVVATGLPFDEILLGHRDDAKKLIGNAFKMAVTHADIESHRDTSLHWPAASVVLGDCKPTGGAPRMLYWVGFSSDTDRFGFRDVPEHNDTQGGTYGFFPDALHIAEYTDCERSGGLHEQDGELFVR
jgi:hypothetical protein